MTDRRIDEPSIFPFFVGAGRSGTTLVRAILDAHPDMAVPDESNFVPVLGRMRARYEGSDGFAAPLLLDDLLEQRRFRRWQLSRDEVQMAFDDAPPANYAEAVRMLFALYARRHGKTRYGDKTPSYVLHMPLLAELFPESRFVHVIRDGRDVALSLLDVDFGPRSVGAAAQLWKAHVTAGRDAGRRLGARRYREVRYEDLLDDPETAVKSICTFIDLPFEPEMLRYFERAESITSPSAWSRRHIVLPPTKGLRDWRRQMPKKEVGLFEELAGDLLTELGYDRALDPPPASVRVRARTAVWSRRMRHLAQTWRRWRKGGARAKKPAPPSFLLRDAPHDRQEVLSFLIAKEAANEPDVAAFREHCLGNQLLTLGEVATWIGKQDMEDGEGPRADILEYLGTDPWPLRHRTTKGGVLDSLRSLSSGLARMYGWQRFQASTFVLTGVPPLIAAIRSRVVGGIPLSSTTRIVLDVDPAATPDDVVQQYRRVRGRLTDARLQPVSEKDLKLAEFVAVRSTMDRRELIGLWNDQYPGWTYHDPDAFHHDAVLARRRILDPW
jgi:Sulfotransferase family